MSLKTDLFPGLARKNHKKKGRRLKAIELFAGAGGMALGIQQAGLDVVALVERDPWCIATLKANQAKAFPRAKIIQTDIATLTGDWLLNEVGLEKGQLDVLSGGPPCQGFSFANNANRSIDDPRSKMVLEFLRLIDEIQPRAFVIENVWGLLSFKDFFYTLLKTLGEHGYIVRFNLLDAVSYGVPQTRRRVFIEGTRIDLGRIPQFPVPTHFDIDHQKKTFPSIPDVAVKCFAVNGFTKEEVWDVKWNNSLWIMMNKKTMADKVDQAINEIVFESVMRQTG
ncbi:MAG: DNA cytosine methyltransferase [Planctomycetes bacterium]|nr:DNA cytosine methyltransferase [Planctomycetota bacterium]